MTNVKFDSRPFEKSLNNLIDDLFSEMPVLFGHDFNNSIWKGQTPVNVKETGTNFEMEIIAPGFAKEDFKITLENGLLTVSAEKKEDMNAENEKQIRREYSFKSFKRSFTIDDKIDATQIDASYINGVLRLNLPKKAEVKPSATEIKIA
jgi:HSP20 family protein